MENMCLELWYRIVWFGLVVVLNGGKIYIEKMLGFRGSAVKIFPKPMFLSWPSLIQIE